ncbi:MAG: hypothetical protein L6Q74_03700 [Sphaerotilus natans subsp. sulfidivorans]|uniref:hypothetical protein n=1 Tax=Sphaerotilus sulfidivorans TaxID=639200 RepID=UPI002355B772|nr:hypothetical protein [Sphaerotilus sulfidivorans]MCK6401007.1 hypothetical protein [Sphaerotilus sulfidivorans]
MFSIFHDLGLGMISVLVQLLLILVLVALFSGRRHLRSRQHRYRDQTTPRRRRVVAAKAETAPAGANVAASRPGRISGLRSDDLLPPSFADTCADWTPLAPQPVERARGCAAAPASDRIDLDAPLRCTALERPFDEADRSLARVRPVLSCTIGRQVHMHA